MAASFNTKNASAETIGGTTLSREVSDPTALLHEITGAALARGATVEELSVTRPSLEDVYLELTEAVA